jgi:hypothetical protein
MNNKKGLKYYGIIFGVSVVALAIYIVYLGYQSGGIDTALLFSLLYVPFIFTLFLFVFDKLFDFIFPSKGKKKDDLFSKYLKVVSTAIQTKYNFSIEDYRRLRENPKFQKALEQAFRILENGETEEISFEFLQKKFKKDSNEFLAMVVVIEEVKKMMINS